VQKQWGVCKSKIKEEIKNNQEESWAKEGAWGRFGSLGSVQEGTEPAERV